MSLIHDALKKAELEKKPSSGDLPQTVNPIIPGKKLPPTKLILYVALILFSIGFLVYFRFLRKPAPKSSIPQPIAPVMNPVNPPVNHGEGQSPIEMKAKAVELYEAGDLEASKELWEKLTITLSTDAEVYNNLGLVLKKMGKKKEAYQAYNQALALKKDYPEALNNLGVLYLSDGMREKAREHFQRAIQFDQTYGDPFFNLGLILEQEGNSRQAVQSYQKYLEKATTMDAEFRKKIEAKISRLQ